MAHIDCFNGDADGICALTQLRLDQPVESDLVTGVKRDIKLLDRVDAAENDVVTVLDVSLDKNRAGLERILSQGAEVFYCDHHFAGEIPDHPKLTSLINTTADVCTSLLVNQVLKSKYLGWAVVGTFGDNLDKSATVLAKPLDLSEKELATLQNLGVYLNYNGYGAQLEDLYFAPAELFKRTSQHASPFAFIQEDANTFATLEEGYKDDMQKAAAASADYKKDHAAVFMLPNEAWARRVSGVFGNNLAKQYPHRAHAIVTERDNGEYLISVRAPLQNKQRADEVCRQFPTGGGRAAAAGVNALPADQLSRFIQVFSDTYLADSQ
ncbi:MAG: DHH family phosphoesterase [Pseudomonadota bacterium]